VPVPLSCLVGRARMASMNRLSAQLRRSLWYLRATWPPLVLAATCLLASLLHASVWWGVACATGALVLVIDSLARHREFRALRHSVRAACGLTGEALAVSGPPGRPGVRAARRSLPPRRRVSVSMPGPWSPAGGTSPGTCFRIAPSHSTRPSCAWLSGNPCWDSSARHCRPGLSLRISVENGSQLGLIIPGSRDKELMSDGL
jgi:hypothetical protein